MTESRHPLQEVFGYLPSDFSSEAERHRKNRLCPFNNRVPNCTKDRANDPLGVCSIRSGVDTAIVCPIRFRQGWRIAEDAARYFFSPGTKWTSLTEVNLKDANGRSAGNIDVVLVAYDERGRVLDFGALEVQAVYVSGNIRRPFEYYMENPPKRHNMDWAQQARHYPRPDYLSSSRKRLVPQLLYKGGILNAWGKKQAVAVHSGLFDTLPTIPSVDPAQADMAWFVYDLLESDQNSQLQLTLSTTQFTMFQSTVEQISRPQPGSIADFVNVLQKKLDDALIDDERNPPDAPTLNELL